MSRYSAWDGIEESGPSAAGLELVCCFIERSVAGGAVIASGGGRVFIVFSCEGRLCAFLADDFELCYGAYMLAGVH
jgi:hypothetical protein